MLRHMPTLEVLQRDVRKDVCSHCPLRTPNSAGLGPEVVRSCELDCPVFIHLPALERVAIAIDPMLGSRREALHRRISDIYSQDLKTRRTDGVKPQRKTASANMSPLWCYRKQLVQSVLKRVGEV